MHETESAARHPRSRRSSARRRAKPATKRRNHPTSLDEALRRFGDEYARLTAEATERVRFVEMKAIEEVERVKAPIRIEPARRTALHAERVSRKKFKSVASRSC